MMKRIRIRLLKIYYQAICVLSDLIKSRKLISYKLLIGTILISLTISSCHARKHTTCHAPVFKSSK